MKITQVYEFVNEATREALGETVVVNEDLSNVVSVGEAIFNANAMDKYVKALVNRIGKVIFLMKANCTSFIKRFIPIFKGDTKSIGANLLPKLKLSPKKELSTSHIK